MSRRLPPLPGEAGYGAPARKIRYPRPRGPAQPPLLPLPGASTYRRSFELSPLLAALGIDYELEDVVELAQTDPDEAARKLASYRKALVPITRQLRGAEADTDAMLRLAGRAKAEGKAAIELVPEVAAAEGWKVRGNPRRKLTITTANGRTMTLAPPVKPAPQPRNRAPRARSPRRRKIRSSSAASRDGPESDSDPLAPRPARAGLEAVLSPDAARAALTDLAPTAGGSARRRRGVSRPPIPDGFGGAHRRTVFVRADPFLGSGATAVAALAEGCDFVGCDVDAAAVETTRRRLEEAAP